MKNLIYLFLAGALALASCGNDDNDEPGTTGPVGVSSVELSKTTLTMSIGEEQTLTATVLPENAADKTVTWESSDPTVASVSDAGVVKALKIGSATITATAGGKSATCSVTVDPTAVESVTLDQKTLTIKRGGSETLTATVAPDDAAEKTVEWSSDKTEIATVDQQGVVTAVAPGTATITAAAGGKSATCTVTVEPNVYVVGWAGSDIFTTKGQLWTNGKAAELPFTQARSVFVSDGKVYVAGGSYDANKQWSAGVWCDGELDTWYPTGNTRYIFNSVYVSGNDIYVASGIADGANLWKNGEKTQYEARGNANSVFVSGADVYVGGEIAKTPTASIAAYWKNGTATELTDGTTIAAINCVVVSKGDVYMVGYTTTADGTQKAMLWKNDTPTELKDGSVARSVAVSQTGDVYVAGLSRTVPVTVTLWKNGEPTKLVDKGGDCYGVYVQGEDVYVAGRYSDKAVLWTNGNLEYLPGGAYANSVFVY